MSKSKDGIIVLYGSSSQGKTSTLKELVRILAGLIPPNKGDIRVIIPDYQINGQKVNIYITTGGDTSAVIEDNIRFFNGKLPDGSRNSTFLLQGQKWIHVNNKQQMVGIEADLCISACRSDGNGVHAMQYFVHSNLSNTFACLWINMAFLRQKMNVPKNSAINPSWRLFADVLKQEIDKKFVK